jgi:hypothetical protein
MLLFEYQEDFSGSENILQASSEAVVHRTSRNVVPLVVSAWLGET